MVRRLKTSPLPFREDLVLSCNLSAIVAVCDDWGIGRNGGMVVANKQDMRHFVSATTGHPIIMGRKTLESFPGGRPLKNRRNIVLTRDPFFHREGVEVVHSVERALDLVRDEDEAWVVGGGQIYQQFLPYCQRAVVTKNHCLRAADAYFPNLDQDEGWELVEQTDPITLGRGEGDEGVSFSFATYERRQLG